MGLHPVADLWAEAWRCIALAYYRAALKGMQAQGKAAHEDIPEIVRAIRRYER